MFSSLNLSALLKRLDWISSNNKITFLVESAEFGHDIDVDRAMLAKERAEKRLAQAIQQEEKISRARAEAALQRAMARLRAAQQARQ